MSLGQRPVFSWLHVSDLHFGHGDRSYGWDQKKVLDCLEEDVENALKGWPELPRPEAIMVTGDIAFSGSVRHAKEYRNANAFLRRLTRTLGLQQDRVFLVPGNHDVQRDVAKDLVQQVREDPGALDTILDSPKKRQKLFARQANYKAFADGFAKRNLDAWSETINVSAFGHVVLLGLNTALVSNDDQDKGQLVLAQKQRYLVSKAKGRVRLILTHHPFKWGWLKDERSLQSMAQQKPAIHLCGHVHEPHVDIMAQEGGEYHIRVVAAAAHRDPKEAQRRKLSHGYNFASLMIDAQGTLQLRTWPRRWFPKWNNFRVDYLGVPDRQFHDDKSMGEQLEGSGLVLDGLDNVRMAGVHWWGEKQVGWHELLYGKSTLEVFGIAVNDLFSQPNIDHVKEFLNRGGTVSVVLADPRHKTGMARYDEDFDKPLGDRYGKVVRTLRQLKQLLSSLSKPRRLTIAVTRYTFKYSAYRIDGDVLFAPYRLFPGKKTKDTPALVFDRGSSVVKRCLGQDLDALLASAKPLTTAELTEITKDVE